MWDYHGFARVAKLISDRSDAKYIFKDWQAGNVRAVEELSVGTYVLALPRVDRDLRWCPIVTLDATEHARFTYIHPQVLQPVVTQKPVVVGHTKERNGRPPSHDIGPKEPGVRSADGKVVLDARWRGHGDDDDHETCSGYCLKLWTNIASDPERLGFILKFAACEGELVCCNRCVHRSVASAMILHHAFGRTVDWQHAACPRQCRLTPRCVAGQDAVNILWSSFRQLPHRVNPRKLLAYKLALPGCLYPFDAYDLPNCRMIEGLEPPAVCLECGDTYSRFCMFYDDQRPPRQRISPVHHDRYGNFWACLLDNKHQCV